jgi:hypothetical protein
VRSSSEREEANSLTWAQRMATGPAEALHTAGGQIQPQIALVIDKSFRSGGGQIQPEKSMISDRNARNRGQIQPETLLLSNDRETSSGGQGHPGPPSGKEVRRSSSEGQIQPQEFPRSDRGAVVNSGTDTTGTSRYLGGQIQPEELLPRFPSILTGGTVLELRSLALSFLFVNSKLLPVFRNTNRKFLLQYVG